MNETIIMPYKETHVSKKDGYKSFFFKSKFLSTPKENFQSCLQEANQAHASQNRK